MSNVHKLVAATLVVEMCDSLIAQIRERRSNSFLERRLPYGQLDKIARSINPSWIEPDGYNTLISGKSKREALHKELNSFGLTNYFKDSWKFDFLRSESVTNFPPEIGEQNIKALEQIREQAKEIVTL